VACGKLGFGPFLARLLASMKIVAPSACTTDEIGSL